MKQLTLTAIAICFLSFIHAQNTTASSTQKTDADYFLSVATINIKTGKDNKEYPSNIFITLRCGNKPIPGIVDGFYLSYNNELPKYSTRSLLIPQYRDYNAKENTLAAYKQYGCKLQLDYFANIAFDAWKIESISLTLQFKDAAGNPHPTMGNKTINFGDSDLWMDGFDKVTTYYKTDKYFNAYPVKQFAMGKLRD